MDEYSNEIRLVVPFHDVDMAGMVWHGHYVKYFEIARSRLLDKYNYSHKEMEESGYLWPVVDLHIKYICPLTYGQEILVKAVVKEWEYRLKVAYIVRDADTLKKLTKAHTIQVAYDLNKKEMRYKSPAVLKKALGIA